MAADLTKPVTLSSLADGALEERLQEALKVVLENVQDPNTKPDAKRTVTIELTFRPDSEREAIGLSVVCRVKLAPAKDVTTVLFSGRGARGIECREFSPRQQGLPLEAGTVVSIQKGS